MARLYQCGFELNTLTANVEFTVKSGGSGSIQTGTVRSGTYALRVNPTSSRGVIEKILFASDQNIDGYARCYMRIATLPSVNTLVLFFGNSADTVNEAAIVLTTTGTLSLRNSANTQIGSATAALSTGVWYCLELRNNATANPGTLTGRLDGVQFASGTNDVQGGWAIAWMGYNNTGTGDLYFDDWAVNDASGSFQNSWCGPGKIIHLRPDAAGDSSQWVPDSGSNFARVNEVTPDDATSFVSDVILNESDMYNVAASGIGSMDTINVVAVGVRFRNDVADATTQFKTQIEKASGGTILQSAAIIPNSTTWKTNATAAPFAYPVITYQDPDSINWTRDTLETMQVGQKSTLIGVNKNQVSAIWTSIDYTPYYPKSLVMNQAMNRAATY